LNRRLQKIAKDLYFAAETESCARLDIRLNEATGELFVIDFNPYPTMFLEGDICSVDKILKFSGCSKR
jgi:D-alanine-D-alanine ligase-like ATP-grasp enzyme